MCPKKIVFHLALATISPTNQKTSEISNDFIKIELFWCKIVSKLPEYTKENQPQKSDFSQCGFVKNIFLRFSKKTTCEI